MKKRAEEKRLMRQSLRIKSARVIIMLIFILLVIASIYAVDASTSRIMRSKDNKHAVAMHIIDDKQLSLELAGEHYTVSIEYFIKLIQRVETKVKQLFGNILTFNLI